MKNAVRNSSKSLKTFYLYAIFVIFIIGISLLIKGFYIIQQSRFDPAHHFTLAVMEQNSVKEIISLQPQTPAVSVLIVQNGNIQYSTLAKDYGIVTDGYIQVGNSGTRLTDLTSLLWSSIIHSATWRCNLTIFDKVRFLLLIKNITTNNKVTRNVTLTTQNSAGPGNALLINALTDQELATENISIQIINATNISGLGQRLARLLTNLGANVIDISNAQENQKKTTIAYFGNESYTLDRIQKLLNVPVSKLNKQPIADIVITIGKDRVESGAF
jgi:LytR cell envelope-related transcriptional attenuator